MKTNRILLSLIAAIALGGPSTSNAGLMFDSPIPGTIADTNGLGTGFTYRLPGTGFSLPSDDPNLDLLANPGYLTLHSTHADLNWVPNPGGSNTGQFEAPGFFLSGIGAQDVSVSALLRDVRLPNGSDQLCLYFGTSSANVISAGFHQQEVYLINEFHSGPVVRHFLSAYDAFAPGDDVILTFGRSSGLWQLSWQNLTTPAASGSSPTVSFPWLDASPDLYVGVLAANAGSGTSFTAKIDSIEIVPEPSFALFGLACLGFGTIRRQRRR